jgi:hypothetical protein
MALQTAAQVEAMFRYTGGETVVHGLITTYGHWSNRDTEFEQKGAAVYGNVKAVRIATGLLTGLDNGDSITVAGTSYTVADHRVIDSDGEFTDGAITEIWLRV